jgi:acyl dehydratase
MSESMPARDFGPVSTEKMKTMAAILQDPNPIHWDVEVVKQLGMGDRPVNQGPINMSFLVNMLTSWTSDPGALRELVIRYQANVFGGDIVHCEGSVDSEDDGLVTCTVKASVDGNPVITGTAILSRRS